jgi:bis(5'-nucleosyl)-tetraphosphatase (symmetrical)
VATYIIGDVQGCYQPLLRLLDEVNYRPGHDRLGFVGDLVNRGPDSLSVLRFIKKLEDPLVVLGNHDLYLLILGFGLVDIDAYENTLQDILAAPDRYELLHWLRHQPFALFNKKHNALLTHAGLAPHWDIQEGLVHAKEASDALKSNNYEDFLLHLFGDEPATWCNELKGWDRLRYIVNAFTRMRFCREDGTLDLVSDKKTSIDPEIFQPWFNWRDPKQDNSKLLFGHWAALEGQCEQSHCYALDTGCVWGNTLTAYCLETGNLTSVQA